MKFAFWTGEITALLDAGEKPVVFGILHDVELDFSGDLKELCSQDQDPFALACGKSQIKGKAKFAQINWHLFQSIYFPKDVVTTKRPVFQALLMEKYYEEGVTLQLNACMSDNLSFSDGSDYVEIVDFVFRAQEDATGNIGSLDVTKLSSC